MVEECFFQLALKEANIALTLGEVPVGAVIVKQGVVISKAHNLRETLKDPLAHAEILAIKKASRSLNDWRLTGCELYVTLEPCPMCAGAIVQSRIKRVYIGTFDEQAGACGSVMNVVQNEAFNHYVDLVWLYNEESSFLIKQFFKCRREQKM